MKDESAISSFILSFWVGTGEVQFVVIGLSLIVNGRYRATGLQNESRVVGIKYGVAGTPELEYSLLRLRPHFAGTEYGSSHAQRKGRET